MYKAIKYPGLLKRIRASSEIYIVEIPAKDLATYTSYIAPNCSFDEFENRVLGRDKKVQGIRNAVYSGFVEGIVRSKYLGVKHEARPLGSLVTSYDASPIRPPVVLVYNESVYDYIVNNNLTVYSNINTYYVVCRTEEQAKYIEGNSKKSICYYVNEPLYYEMCGRVGGTDISIERYRYSTSKVHFIFSIPTNSNDEEHNLKELENLQHLISKYDKRFKVKIGRYFYSRDREYKYQLRFTVGNSALLSNVYKYIMLMYTNVQIKLVLPSNIVSIPEHIDAFLKSKKL